MRDQRLKTALDLSLVAADLVTVELLASCAGLSPARFSQLFSRETGMLPGEYLRIMKQFRRERVAAIEILTKSLQDAPSSDGDSSA